MKVAIITINDNNNYGNRLQNYALQKYLFSKLKIEEIFGMIPNICVCPKLIYLVGKHG